MYKLVYLAGVLSVGRGLEPGLEVPRGAEQRGDLPGLSPGP
jgi:hypothetical protein